MGHPIEKCMDEVLDHYKPLSNANRSIIESISLRGEPEAKPQSLRLGMRRTGAEEDDGF